MQINRPQTDYLSALFLTSDTEFIQDIVPQNIFDEEERSTKRKFISRTTNSLPIIVFLYTRLCGSFDWTLVFGAQE